MGRYSRGGRLLKVRLGSTLLACAAGVPLFSTVPAYGLSVNSLVDNVVSVSKLNEPDAVPSVNNSQGISKSADQPRPAALGTSQGNTVSRSAVELVPVVVAVEPLDTLPPIDAFNRQPLAVHRSDPNYQVVARVAALSATSKPAASILQSSDHGWRIFGVSWYAWGLAGVVSVYAIRWTLSKRLRLPSSET